MNYKDGSNEYTYNIGYFLDRYKYKMNGIRQNAILNF